MRLSLPIIALPLASTLRTSLRYDYVGNTTADGRANLSFAYNILNLPETVTSGNTQMATYHWLSDGTKYKVTDPAGNGVIYAGDLTYTVAVSGGNTTYALESAEASADGTARFLKNGTAMTPYYTIRDHLGSVRTIVNASGNVVERNDYYPFGSRTTFGASYATLASNHQKFSGKEDQTAVAGVTLPYLDFGARMYDAKLVRWNTYDPMAEKYYGINPYVYCGSNPVSFIDDKGREPILPYAGTITGFVNFMNRISTGIGLSTGASAHAAMLRMGEVNGLKPANTAPFNSSDNNRYIYTEIGGWIDMAHFMFYAGRAYRYRQIQQQANDIINTSSFRFLSLESQAIWIIRAGINPVSEAIRDGYLQEFSDNILVPRSAYSYEDLPSDKYGAIFGAHYFNPDSKQSFSEQILIFFTTVLKATDPMDAPNIKALPSDYPDKPTKINRTTDPLFIKN